MPAPQIESTRASLVPLLRELMRETQVTQRDLAAGIGATSSQLNLFFTGKSDMHSRKLVGLLRALGIDLEEILEQRLNEIRNQESPKSQTALHAKISALGEHRREPLLAIIKMLAD